MNSKLIEKLAVVSLLPTVCTLMFVALVVIYLANTARDPQLIHVAAQQSLIATQFQYWLDKKSKAPGTELNDMIHDVAQFDAGLKQMIGSDISDALMSKVKSNWEMLKPRLIIIAQAKKPISVEKIQSVKNLITTAGNLNSELVKIRQYKSESLLRITVLLGLLDFVFLLLGTWILHQNRLQQRENNRQLQLQAKVIDEVNNAVIVCDLSGIIRSWNNGARRLFGFTQDEILGKHIDSLYPAHNRDYLQTHVIEPVLTYGEHKLELALHKESGEPVVVNLSLSLVRQDNRPSAITAYAIDVTDRISAENEARQSEQRIQNILESTSDWVWETDAELKYTYISPQIEKMLGYEFAEIIGKSLFDLMDSAEAQRVQSLFDSLQKDLHPVAAIGVEVKHKKGQLVTLEISGFPYIDETGNCLGYRGVNRDTTIRTQTENALLRLAEDVSVSTGQTFFSSLVTNLVQTLDVDFALVAKIENNEAHTIALSHAGELIDNITYSLVGAPCAEVMRQQYCCYAKDVQREFPEDSLLAEIDVSAYAGVKVVDTFGKIVGLVAVLKKSELTNPSTILSILKLYGLRVASEFDRYEHENRLQKLAHYDPLTGIPNRMLFVDRLENVLTRTEWHDRQVGVMFIDLDRFKEINDTLGHSVGDSVLQLVADRLQQNLRHGDSVARLGGDEFVVLLNDVAKEKDIIGIAEKIINVFSAPFEYDGHELFVTASIGISIGPRDGNDAGSLMKNADSAMYTAKSKGKNTYYIYNEELGKMLEEKFRLEKDMRLAISNEEFCTYYQPQVNLKTGEIVGLEALLRWNHPVRGIVRPGEFVPILEETGLIESVGKIVLKQVVKQLTLWEKMGLRKQVAINISPAQFNYSNLVSDIKNIITAYEIDPRLIEVEITENVLLHDSSLETLSEIKNLGLKVSIDDFGTGYSAINYLKKFAFDGIKLDRSFVQDISQKSDDAAIAKAMIEMSHELGMTVTAEGVETEAQLKFLRESGCDLYQGFYFSKPQSVDAITAMLQQEIKQNSRRIG